MAAIGDPQCRDESVVMNTKLDGREDFAVRDPL